MNKTIRLLLLMALITGTLFSACNSAIVESPPPTDEESAPAIDFEFDAESEVHEDTLGDDELILEEHDAEEVEDEPAVEEPVVKDEPVEKEPVVEEVSTPEPQATTDYKDGVYSKVGSYSNPAGGDSINVSLTLKNDVVTALTVTSTSVNATTKNFQGLFIEGIN
ncbi:MAG: hypothetical protein O3B47_03140, partial [bacterium]|nr:hypothetical protein [bacterium]